jgi:hypothetical protein
MATYPLIITQIKQTCYACPSQWSGKSACGQDIYIRFRYGYLQLDVNDETVYGEQMSDEMDGCLNFIDMKFKLKDYIQISSEAEKDDNNV